jgi:tRNA(fMet)-specific endonuclease VapC
MAVIRLCLDTSAYSRLMRGRPKLQERLEAADEILLPATMLGEVYAGFHGGNRLEENLSLLATFRRQPGVAIVDTTDNVAQRYATIVATLKRQGTPIPTNDIWIAAAALENGGRMVAYDSHFEAVPGLIVEAP